MSYIESGESNRLNVFSLNTCFSGGKYGRFSNILDFIHSTEPHVVLLQEVYKKSLGRILNAFGGSYMAFSPMCRLSLTDKEEDADYWGVAICSKYPLSEITEDYYHRDKSESNTLVLNGGIYSTSSLLQATLEVGSARFHFGTTHFTWVRGAQPSDEQLEDFAKLAVLLDKIPDVVLTGDFNSPRGYPIFDSLAESYKDNIPSCIKTTLDMGVNPEAIWEHVVDGFFTSRHYRVESVEMVSGLSDHQGILGEVQRAAS